MDWQLIPSSVFFVIDVFSYLSIVGLGPGGLENEKDCYLRVPFESQTTKNPNQQFTIFVDVFYFHPQILELKKQQFLFVDLPKQLEAQRFLANSKSVRKIMGI